MAELPDVGPAIPVSSQQMRQAALTLAERSLRVGQDALHDLAYLLSCVGLARVREDEKLAVHNALNSDPPWHEGGSGVFTLPGRLPWPVKVQYRDDSEEY